MLKTVVGHSNDPDSLTAITEVLGTCQQVLGGVFPQAGILFTGIDFDHALILQEIQKAFPNIQLIGGTTNGEISSVLEFQQDSITLMLFASHHIQIQAGVGYNVSQNPLQSSQNAIAQAKAKSASQPKLCITFPESLTSSGAVILEGLQQSLGKIVPIIGGMTADDYTFDQTYQFFQDQVLTDAVPVLLFSGDLLVSYGVASGWTPITPKSRITKVQGNVVYEIENQPALEFYRHYLGGERFLTHYAIHALAVYEDQENFYMRAPNGYDLEAGSLTFFGDIPDQAIVQITDASRENILAASQVAIQKALSHYPGTEPTTALLVSCAARRRILGTLTPQEYQLTKTHLPQNLSCCGFYAYGEIAPLDQHNSAKFHNKTFVTLLMGEI